MKQPVRRKIQFIKNNISLSISVLRYREKRNDGGANSLCSRDPPVVNYENEARIYATSLAVVGRGGQKGYLVLLFMNDIFTMRTRTILPFFSSLSIF